ncbi:MAG TPA: response regulator [Rhodocyclaceae bacterium]
MSAENELPKVLIVDDSRIVRATLSKHLKGQYSIREEGDGEAGWQALTVDTEIQVVLSDLTMPKLDGYGFLERIRSSKVSRIRNIPVLLISGDEDESARQRAKTLGASDFIAKGIGTTELLTRLKSLMQLAQTQTELDESRDQQVKDPVSGLFTRVYAVEQAAQMLAYASRHQVPSSIIVVAVDQARMIREKAGDAAANQLMKALGQIMLQKVRREDTLAIYEPNAVAVVSPSTPDGGAMIFVERLRETFEQANITFQGKRLVLTASVGFASVPPDKAADAIMLMELAGKRMTEAVAAGGNRVIGSAGHVAGPPGVPSLETALTLARAGRQAELTPHLAPLVLRVLPLLAAANSPLGLGLDIDQLQQKLKGTARKDA